MAAGFLESRCRLEVIELHELIEAWLSGSAPRRSAMLARFADALDERFLMVGPDGSSTPKATLVSRFEAAHGREGREFRVAIERSETVASESGICVLRYEEHQVGATGSTRRSSTAVFRRSELAPRGVAWLHLQETWLAAE